MKVIWAVIEKERLDAAMALAKLCDGIQRE